jgi:hypothetical protein
MKKLSGSLWKIKIISGLGGTTKLIYKNKNPPNDNFRIC